MLDEKAATWCTRCFPNLQAGRLCKCIYIYIAFVMVFNFLPSPPPPPPRFSRPTSFPHRLQQSRGWLMCVLMCTHWSRSRFLRGFRLDLTRSLSIERVITRIRSDLFKNRLQDWPGPDLLILCKLGIWRWLTKVPLILGSLIQIDSEKRERERVIDKSQTTVTYIGFQPTHLQDFKGSQIRRWR